MISAKFTNMLDYLQLIAALEKPRITEQTYPPPEESLPPGSVVTNDSRWHTFRIPVKGALTVEPGISPFARGDLNTEVTVIYQAGGLQRDVVIDRFQMNYLGTVERAYHSRAALPTRALVHSLSRKKGHGHAQGLFADIKERIITASSVSQ